MKITVEFLSIHTAKDYHVSRVPCVGEVVVVDDACYDVVMVAHYCYTRIADAPSVAAIVRVK